MNKLCLNYIFSASKFVSTWTSLKFCHLVMGEQTGKPFDSACAESTGLYGTIRFCLCNGVEPSYTLTNNYEEGACTVGKKTQFQCSDCISPFSRMIFPLS